MLKNNNDEFVNTNTNTDETIPTNNSELTSENNTNTPQQPPTDTATFNNSDSHDSEATQNIDPKLASSIDKIEDIKNDIRDSIEKEIPSEEQEKDILNNKFENLASAMETFRDQLNTEKGKDEFENSKEYLEEAGLIIQDVKDNDGTKDNEIKGRILNLIDKTIPQAMGKVLSVDKEAMLNSPKDVDAINNDDKVNINNIDISQFEKNSEMFKDAFKDATADNKQEVFNKLCDVYQNSNPDISANDAKIITNAICRIYEEDKLEKINAVRTSIHQEKDGLIGITKGYRYESKKEIGNFEKALDRISGEIDNLGKQLMSDVSLVKCQELKKDFVSMRNDIEKGLEKIKAVGSDQNIKEFRRDIYRSLDSIDKKIDEIKENEFVVIGSDIDVYVEEVDKDYNNIEKEDKAETVYKDPEKTGDAKVDRFNAKLAQYEFAAGIGKWNTKEKNNASADNGQINQEDSQKSSSTISRNESNPYYTWNTLVRDIYAHSRGILIDGTPVTTGKIIADIGNIVLSEGIIGSVLLGVIGGICVLIERLIHGAEKGEADHVDRNEEIQDFINELYNKIEKEYGISDDVDKITEQDQVDNDVEDNQSNDTSNDEEQKDNVDKNNEDEKQSKDTEKSEEDTKQVDDDKSDVDKKTIDNKAEEDKKSPGTTNSDDQENKVDNDEKPEEKKDSKDTDKPEDDKSKIDNTDESSVDNKSSDKADDNKKEQGTDKKEDNTEKNIEYDKDWKDRIQSTIEKYDYKKIPYSTVKKEINECRKAIPDVDRRTNTLAMAAKDAFASHTNKWPGKSHNSRMENVNSLITGSANSSSPSSSASSSLLSRFNNVIQAIIDVGKAKISAIGAFFKSHSSVFAKVGVTVAIGVGTILIMPSGTKAADVEARVEKEQVVSTVETKSETSFEAEKIEVDGLTIDLSDVKTDDKIIQEEQGLTIENTDNNSDDTKKDEDDKDKIESSENENRDIESSKEESIKEKSIESKDEKKQEDQTDRTDKVETDSDSDTDSKVDQAEKDSDPIDIQELDEKDNQNIEADAIEEKIESDTNDTETKNETSVEVEESEQEAVDQEDSNEQEAVAQEQDETEIQEENKDVEESEEETDQVETNEEEPESVEVTEVEVQEEPEDSAAEGTIEQDSPEEDTSKEDDAVAAMDDSDDEDQKKKDSGAVEDSSSDSQEEEDTQDESDSDSVDIDGHSEEVDPEDEKIDAKEAATGDDKSEKEEQTGIEKDEEEKENVESLENNAEQNDTIDNLSEGMQDASLDATNEEAANKIETVSTDNEGNVETTTVDSITEPQTDIPEEQNISFVDSVLNNLETNDGDINDVIVDEILDRGGNAVDFASDIDELINKGYDIDVDYIADTIFAETTELIEPNITFGFGSDGTIYDVGNSDLGVTPQDISVEAYDNNINDIDLESMIDSTASDFATYTEDTIEAIISDTTLPDVDKVELDDKIDTVDNGLELNQLEKVNASDNLDNAADNASREFDPSDNNQNNNVDIVDPDQYQNNNDVSEPDVDIDYDSIFRE